MSKKEEIYDDIGVFLYFSEMASFLPEKIKEELPGSIFIEDKGTDTQLIMVPLGYPKESLVIAFRGTEAKIRDWLTDFDGFHTIYPYGNTNSNIQVHKGFVKAYHSIRTSILKYIKDNREECKAIFVCGHSLGGALATLCAVDIQYNYPDIKVKCFPSGNPRVGNKDFAVSYDKRVPDTFRTQLRTDIVPLFPPRWIQKLTKGGYVHTGQKISIGPFDWLIGLKTLIKLKFKSDRLSADLTNHAIKLYKYYIAEA